MAQYGYEVDGPSCTWGGPADSAGQLWRQLADLVDDHELARTMRALNRPDEIEHYGTTYTVRLIY